MKIVHSQLNLHESCHPHWRAQCRSDDLSHCLIKELHGRPVEAVRCRLRVQTQAPAEGAAEPLMAGSMADEVVMGDDFKPIQKAKAAAAELVRAGACPILSALT